MNISSFRGAFLYTKYGSGILLLLFDVLLLLFLGIDILSIHSLGLNYFLLIRSKTTLEGFGLDALLNFLILLILPIFFALLGNFLIFKIRYELYYKHTTGSMTKSWLIMLHIFVVLLCIAHSNVLDNVQQVSGFCGSLGTRNYCFLSKFSFLENHRVALLISGILLPIGSMFVKDVIYKGSELAREFDFWRLIGAVGEYQPAYGDEIIYVNSASMAPSIKSINSKTISYHYRYQRAVPTSDSAKRFLLEKASDARKLLNEYLLDSDEKLSNTLYIEFFPGTSRALEAGILRIGNVSHIILSQYEHPSQVDVVKWICETKRALTYKSLLPEVSEFFQESWESQKAKVCEAIEGNLAGREGERVAIVLSEVHYITGIHVRVGEIIKELRSRHHNLVFIIDGSQAVGNLQKPLRRFADDLLQDDFYYFSAHKWLLSPNTCGVLISHVKTPQLQPYDVFGFNLPTSTIDPNTIFGLASALEFLFDRKKLFERFAEISCASKAYFKILARQESRFQIVESATSELNSSLFLAVKPELGYRWKYNSKRFWEDMRNRGVDLTVIPESKPHFDSEQDDELAPSEIYLLRLSFPYFLIGRNVRNLVGHLNAVLLKAN